MMCRNKSRNKRLGWQGHGRDGGSTPPPPPMADCDPMHPDTEALLQAANWLESFKIPVVVGEYRTKKPSYRNPIPSDRVSRRHHAIRQGVFNLLADLRVMGAVVVDLDGADGEELALQYGIAHSNMEVLCRRGRHVYFRNTTEFTNK